MSEVKHTETPWKFVAGDFNVEGIEDSAIGSIISDDSDQWYIATVEDTVGADGEPLANAEFIVLACNSHARLVAENEALMKALRENLRLSHDSRQFELDESRRDIYQAWYNERHAARESARDLLTELDATRELITPQS